MKTLLSIILIFLLSFNFSQAENIKHIKLNNTKQNQLKVENISSNGFQLQFSFDEMQLNSKETKKGKFEELTVKGLLKSYDIGKPALPLLSKLIEVPIGSEVQLKLVSYTKEVIKLHDYDINNLIIPAQRSLTKSEDPDKIDFQVDENIYSKNEFFKNEIIRFEESGIMRDTRLGTLIVSPISYNPVKNEIEILNDLVIEIEFKTSISENVSPKSITNSALFESIYRENVLNYSASKELISSTPITYVIVSDPMFKETLQPLIDWKIKKGFHVIETYIDNEVLENNTTSIKNYLKNLYENPAEGLNPPSFVLLVGDVAQVPTFNGLTDTHPTDLYYFEYTDDNLPEVFYGRMSATTVEQLEPQIEKTLQVEQYTMPNTSYLNNVVLVAGVDAEYATTHGNGFINYANQYYINEENGLTSKSYLYPESGSSDAQVRSDISSGVALANYTAHCSESGWADPTFSISHIAEMTNKDMYPLIIGNCCLSSRFNTTCFAEEITRAKDKGAVGYIGASNSSLWDEDYYWGVGLTSNISTNPTYEGSGLGAYDRFFHNNGETQDEWYITQAQMIVAGNLAVEASTSGNKAYYWEIYHLMGDPSLIPYITVPDAMTVTHPTILPVGSTTVTVYAEENALVAISTMNGDKRVLLDSKRVSSTGNVVLNFDALTIPGANLLDIVVTKQNRQPYSTKLTVIAPDGPYVILDTVSVNDASGNNNNLADYGENVNLDLRLKNLGVATANNVNLSISTNDQLVTLTNNTNYAIGTILVNATTTSTGAFNLSIPGKFEDQYKVAFDVSITGADKADYTWESQSFELILNAPVLEIGKVYFNDDFEGNTVDGIIDAGETAEIMIEIINDGHADASNISATLSLPTASDYLTINDPNYTISLLEVGEIEYLVFNISSNNITPVGTSQTLNVNISFGEFENNEELEIILGEIPLFIMGEDAEIITCTGDFYDSGYTSNYSNNLNQTVTFYPSIPGNYMKFEFEEFNLESDYDYLYIYNGESTDAPQIVGSPFTGAAIDQFIYGLNETGTLTFKFISDVGVTESGWHAKVSCIDGTVQPELAENPLPANEELGTSTSAVLSWSHVEGAITYDVYFGENLPTEVSETLQANSFNPGVLKPNTTFYWKIVPKNINGEGPAVDFCPVWSFTTGELEIAMSNNEITTCSATFQDSGLDNDYRSNENYILTIYPEIDGHMIEVKFNEFDIELDWDYMYIYDSNTMTTAGFLGEFTGSDLNSIGDNGVITATNETGALTFRFYSDESNVEAGWTAMVSCVTVEAVNDVESNNISIYPNPSNGLFTFNISPELNPESILIYDLNGRNVFQKTINQNEFNIDLSDLEKGVYFYSIKSTNKILKGKLILK